MSEQADNVSNIQDMINAAKAAAGNMVTTSAPAASAQVVALPTGGRAVSVREMVEQAPMRPDQYIRPDKAGFLIGKDTSSFIEEVVVEFRLDQAKAFYGLRYGNPPKYERSYDRILNSVTKQPWATTCAMASSLDPKCKGDYPAVDLLFTVVDEIKGKKDIVLSAAGKTLGWTSSITNFAEFAAFIAPYYDLIDAGIMKANALVRGTIYCEQAENGTNVWGLLKFKDDFQLVDNGEARAAA